MCALSVESPPAPAAHAPETALPPRSLEARLARAVESLIEKVAAYNPRADRDAIRRAAECAHAAHVGQERQDGTPYIFHPIATAGILAELEMDQASILAGLLHDVLEDSAATREELEAQFGSDVAALVDGVTKLPDEVGGAEVDGAEKRRQSERKRRAENLHKVLLSMSRDLRVIIIKLADRLHNMRTLQHLSDERRQRIARETLQVYAPLAHRLGIWHLKWQLEDLSFRYLMSEEYDDVARKVAKTRAAREGDLAGAVEVLRGRLAAAGIHAEIQGRPKHLYSIYQKMQLQELDFSDIYDLMAIRVIVNTVEECYQALGVVHDLWVPIRGFFADYIARPKPNNYQSLHTKVAGPTAEPLEVQIRTWGMHRSADFGVAAHWRYKEGGKADAFEDRLATLRQRLFEWQSDTHDSRDFLRSVMEDLLADQVFVFTPKGEVIDLPAGSTPVDFAYRIHSDLGDHCVGAKVNGRMVSLDYAFHNADVVQIITRSTTGPSLDWLAFVKTASARNRIKRYLRRLSRDDDIVRGREQFERELDRRNLERIDPGKHERVAELSAEMNYQSVDDLLAAIGHGLASARTVVERLKLKPPPPPPVIELPEPRATGPDLRKIAISAGGQDGLLLKLGKCCSPLPGDAVIGYVSRGRGMVIHRVDCSNAIKYYQREPERLVTVDWQDTGEDTYPARLQVLVVDRVGVLNAITAIVSEARVNISKVTVNTEPNRTGLVDLTLEVRSTDHLAGLMRRIESLSDVFEVRRTEPSYARRR
ncbi:MAG: bifunctional (p)ppGpp synthetase/guanosine-3',5'-bis(diphosphate) 3'-pyrophosphohydrolase [Armatimonadetes bacterium]|nr:bifunctional (p)ppGpp synthetase/guanosine-3',5'-bis(diphosphate) 3'-pyrophosphohydrolase [Armatimonadota bacterium]